MRATKFLLLGIALLTLSTNTFGQDIAISSSKGTQKFSYRSNKLVQSFDLETRGKIDLTDDDKDVKRISSDGYLEIEKTVFGSKRRIVITPEGDGLKREYYEGRTEKPFEPEGRKWLAEILPELVKTSTLGAEGRVNRFYRRGGVPTVIAEIKTIESDYVKSAYSNLLMKLPIAVRDYPTIITEVIGTIDSDHYRTEFLEGSMDKFATNKESIDAICAASVQMESDHYKTQVIKSALKNKSISPEAMKSILAAAGKMESDHYITEVITTLLKQDVSDAIISEAITASKSIESDHYRSVVLRTSLSKPNLSANAYKLTLESVKDIESDHYKTEVLTTLLKNELPAEQIFGLVDMSTSIHSDHYLAEVFTRVLSTQSLSDDNFKKLMTRVSLVESDHYATVILKSALNKTATNDARLISVLETAGSMDSDHYTTDVLLAAAPKVVAAGDGVKTAYRTAAKRINSETYYGKALRAID